MIITTSGRPGEITYLNVVKAQQFFSDAIFIERDKRSIKQLQEQFKDLILVAGENRFELYTMESSDPFFYHPNSASFRIKRMIKGEKDPLIEAADLLPEDRFLDCTAGLASDALVASWFCNQPVTAIESKREIAFITAQGLKCFQHKIDDINAAMRKINIHNEHADSYLKNCLSDSFDVVYFDPMFHEAIQSEGLSHMRELADYDDGHLYDSVQEAVRVARKTVVLKDHFRSNRFHQLGFERIIRPSTKQHYGVISVK
ncbi:class I SAM-dependent methyltransferase [Jeotgalibacillus salarius]|uniref:class I SAM-dependent methyltransferase n=1 Tax=Jeotgalibacillus salarius TaxID=546023 RepID=UPI00141A8F4C|nr:class I SAM-dependent methyltransferase [Jeotgalibacillus salarius]